MAVTKPFEKIISLLDKHRIKYRLLTHRPVFTSAEADAVRPKDVTISQGAKALLFKTETQFCLFVLPGDRKLDLGKVRRTAGVSRIRFATKQEVVEVMGCEVGACYPIGSICGIKTYVDKTLAQNHQVAFNAGEHIKSVVMRYADYVQLAQPIIADISQDAKNTK